LARGAGGTLLLLVSGEPDAMRLRPAAAYRLRSASGRVWPASGLGSRSRDRGRDHRRSYCWRARWAAVRAAMVSKMFISARVNGRVYLAERSLKGSSKLLWSIATVAATAGPNRVEAAEVPKQIRRKGYRALARW
jgi:hypothetical protein